MKTNKLTFMAMFLAVALVLHMVEAMLPPFCSVPGVKLGLANVITLMALRVFGKGEAFVLLMLRVVLGALISGNIMASFYGFAGGVLCFVIEMVTNKLFDDEHIWMLSIIGAIMHNVGQIMLAVVLTSTTSIIWYFFPLTLAAIITGLLTGFVTMQVLKFKVIRQFRL